MSTGNSAALHALAEKTAATIQATVRRWWLDPANRHLLHIAAERTFVGARPIAVHFTVRLQPAPTVAAAGPARMQVGVSVEPPPAAGRSASPQPSTRPTTAKAKRQTRATVSTKRGNSRKPRVRASAPARAQQSKKRAQPSVSRKKNRTSLGRTSRRKTGRRA
jgi:hypothetical protein